MNIAKMFACLVSAIALQAPAQTADDAAVWAKVDALNTAVFGTKDGSVMKALLSEKASYGHSAGALENKAEMVANAVASRTTYRDTSTQKVSLVIQDNTAIARHIFSAVQKDTEGKESDLRLGVVQVWMKAGADWELMARQAVRLPAK